MNQGLRIFFSFGNSLTFEQNTTSVPGLSMLFGLSEDILQGTMQEAFSLVARERLTRSGRACIQETSEFT